MRVKADSCKYGKKKRQDVNATPYMPCLVCSPPECAVRLWVFSSSCELNDMPHASHLKVPLVSDIARAGS